MTGDEYQAMAARTVLDEEKAAQRIYGLPQAVALNHAALGCASEAGELCSAIEKWVYFGRDLDRANVVAELGDILWYIALACNTLHVSMSAVMGGNISKLRGRFPEKFSNEQSVSRDEKSENQAVLDTLEKGK